MSEGEKAESGKLKAEEQSSVIEVPRSVLAELVEEVRGFRQFLVSYAAVGVPPASARSALSVAEVATLLGKPRSTIRKWAGQGKLPNLPKRGKSWIFDRTRIEALISGEKVELKRKASR